MTDEPDTRPDVDLRIDGEDEPEILEVEAVPDDAPPPSGDHHGDGAVEAADLDGLSAAGEDDGVAAQSDEVASLQARVAARDDDLLRVRADFENYRKRQERDRVELARHAAARLVEQVLPVIDNFRRALDAEVLTDASDDYKQGIRMIYEQLYEVLTRAGLTPIETTGQQFDPELHEAVAREETTEIEANLITEELERGYLFQNRLLKPARVRVAVAPQS